ncbi:hypothetical protein [Streptomyces chartreusis]|uniref:hypothetical protein n=1 Tax=Streptomyces chartreusis TaxID=1969 RepID=UPI0035DEA13D
MSGRQIALDTQPRRIQRRRRKGWRAPDGAVYVGRHVLPADTQPLLDALTHPPCPPDTAWQVMTRRGGWHTWLSPHADREEARADYEHAVTTHGDKWAYRLVRVTTSYAVEAEHIPEQP